MNFLHKLRSLFLRRKIEAEMAEEMRGHVELQTEANVKAGMAPEEARYAALRQFGNVAIIQEQAREGRGWIWLEMFGMDMRIALRRLLRTPVFTVTALITLAVCIGANTAIFAVVDALVLRPLPFPEPGRLMTVINSYPGNGIAHGGPSIPNYFERRVAVKAFTNVAIFQSLTEIVGEPGNLRQIEVGRVTPDFFAALGVSLAMGQMFTDAELTYQTGGVVILTDELWHAEFGADPDVIGKKMIANGLPGTVIGVLPAGFRFLSSRAQFFKPLAFNPPERALANRHNSLHGTVMVARLAPGATTAEAQAQLDALDAHVAEVDPKGSLLADWGYRSLVRPLHTDTVREIRPTLLLLQGGVLVLLLIGAVNLTNLLLVRISGRSRELAVRQALGARQSHLARETWLETTLLALAGGVLGLAVGAAGVRMLMTLGANQLPLGATILFDLRVTLIVIAAALLLGALLAVVPIWFVRRLSINAQLQSGTAGGLPGGASHRLRQLFGALQIALAFVLLCGAGLLGVSLHRALSQPVGFSPEHALTGSMSLPWKGYPTGRHQAHFAYRLEQAMAALPGGIQFSVTNDLPFSGSLGSPIAVEGQAGNASGSVRTHLHAAVTSGHWRTMGIPLIRGQLLGDESYGPKSPRVCVIDQAMADIYWPGGDPVGQRLSFGTTFNPAAALTIVGVVGNVKHVHLADGQPKGMVYLHFGQFPTGWLHGVVRGPVPPSALAEMLRKAAKEIDPEMIVPRIRTMEQIIDDSLLTRRSPATLAALFASIALILSAVGTYGVLNYAVAQRRREIGVRMALGAQRGQIARQFLKLGLQLLVFGVLLGVLGAAFAGKAMESVLFGVPAFHVPTVLITTGLLAVISLVACWLPARRATQVDPMVALRAE